MHTVRFKFTKTSHVVETGGVEIKVKDPTDWEEIERKLENKEFSALLTSDRVYEGEEWDFDDLPEYEEDDGGTAA